MGTQKNRLNETVLLSTQNTCSGPLADSHEIKVFYKGYFRQNKGCSIEILTKNKEQINFYFLSDPDDNMKGVQRILNQ